MKTIYLDRPEPNRSIIERGRAGAIGIRDATNTALVTTRILAERANDGYHDIRQKADDAKKTIKKFQNFFK